MTFKELGLSDEIVATLTKIGYEAPTLIQEKTIPLILENKDVVGRSETGSGKTMAFALPCIQRIDRTSDQVQCLVICPTRELAMQGASEIAKVTSQLNNIRVVSVYGGEKIGRQIFALKKRPQIIVGTPGRILDHLKRKTIKLDSLKTVILDECDEMLDMGFIDDIKTILSKAPSDKQALLFSATIPQEIKEIIKTFLKDEVLVEIGTENKALDNIEEFYLTCDPKDKLKILKSLLATYTGKVIVFANTKRMVERIYEHLCDEKVICSELHGDMQQRERTKVMNSIKNGDSSILIATDVAARGIDVKDVNYVINYDLPDKREFYIHRIGRTARAGASGKAINIISGRSQFVEMKQLEKMTKAEIKPLDFEGNTKEDFGNASSYKGRGNFGRSSGFKKFGGDHKFNHERTYSHFGRTKGGFEKKSDFGERSEHTEQKADGFNDNTNSFEKSDGFKGSFGHGENRHYGARRTGYSHFNKSEEGEDSDNGFHKHYGERREGYSHFGSEHRYGHKFGEHSENRSENHYAKHYDHKSESGSLDHTEKGAEGSFKPENGDSFGRKSHFGTHSHYGEHYQREGGFNRFNKHSKFGDDNHFDRFKKHGDFNKEAGQDSFAHDDGFKKHEGGFHKFSRSGSFHKSGNFHKDGGFHKNGFHKGGFKKFGGAEHKSFDSEKHE